MYAQINPLVTVNGPRSYASALITFISFAENAPRGRRVEARAPAAYMHVIICFIRSRPYLSGRLTASSPISYWYYVNFALAREAARTRAVGSDCHPNQASVLAVNIQSSHEVASCQSYIVATSWRPRPRLL